MDRDCLLFEIKIIDVFVNCGGRAKIGKGKTGHRCQKVSNTKSPNLHKGEITLCRGSSKKLWGGETE